MFRSRLAEASLIGCLTALASFCAFNARGGETYSIVAQSTRSSAATGRRPLAERITAANLPIITQTAAAPAATSQPGPSRPPAAREATDQGGSERRQDDAPASSVERGAAGASQRAREVGEHLRCGRRGRSACA